MEGVCNLLRGKGLRVVQRLKGDILGVQVVADPLGYRHIPLLQNELRPFPKEGHGNRSARNSPKSIRVEVTARGKIDVVVFCFVIFVNFRKTLWTLGKLDCETR